MIRMNMPPDYGCVLERLRVSSTGKLTAGARFEADSAWFDGHFPGRPILPGIAQLGMVTDVLHHHTAGKLRVTGFKRVRFRRVIQPGDELHISLEMATAQNIMFQIVVSAEVACSGIILVEPINQCERL